MRLGVHKVIRFADSLSVGVSADGHDEPAEWGKAYSV